MSDGGPAASVLANDRFTPPSRLTLGASTLIYALSVILISVSPIMAGLYADVLKLSNSEVGWILSIEQAGGVGGAVFAFWATPRVRWKALVIGASLVALLANALTGFMTDFVSLAVTRLWSGLACNTITLVASCMLARASQPDRAFGAGLFSACVITGLWIWLLHVSRETLGYQATIGLGALLFVASMLLALVLPRTLGGPGDAGPGLDTQTAVGETTHVAAARAGLAGLVLFGISLTIVWGFLERLGLANGLSNDEVSWAFGIGLLGSGLGALAPMLIGDAGNRVRMLSITTLLLFASLGFTWWARGVVMFTVAVSLLAGAWNMGLAYYMAHTSTNDASGRYTRAIYIAIAVSQSIGPALAALILGHARLGSVLVASPLPAFLALALVVVVGRRKKRA